MRFLHATHQPWLPCTAARLRSSRRHEGVLPCRRRLPQLRVVTVRAQAQSGTTDDDYYSLLGVSPTAGTTEIKKAYRAVMREYHPDLSQDEDSTDFAIFINEVYETLLDPDSRAAYDAIAGFTPNAINPFLDRSYERELVFVDEFTCIGCKNCANVCPKTFKIEDEYGRARVMAQSVDGVPKLQEAIDTCPVSCIHWVSAPQLALLEDQMAKMERVAAWLLMTGGGRGANLSVFAEASMAWEKRQQQIRARMDRAKWGWWEPSMGATAQASAQRASDQSGTDEDGGSGSGSSRGPLGKRATAASVAAAARKWRDYQRRRRNRESEPRLLQETTSGSSSLASVGSVDS